MTKSAAKSDQNEQIDIPSDIAAMSFEQALEALEAIVRDLEKGETALEQAIEVYERGNALRRHCAKKLEEAKMRVEKIQLEHGAITTTALD